MKKETFYKICITVGVFWILDFVIHFTGVGETTYYYLSKFANAALFSFIWFSLYNKKEHVKKLLFSIFFGAWISFYYLVFSYSGLVQILGVYARNAPPAFVIFGLVLSPFFWWIFHVLAFYLGLEISSKLKT
ncbi:hypothetical protein HY500_04195 [Candidatus Woesearchaeota archaeon]|nr:hypothetical protein [Candidatus Woesearchaeota archaeon]